MKLFMILFSCGICLQCCYNNAGHMAMEKNTGTGKGTTINFKTQVQPLLEKHCSPCHFPGGKLYEKLPFDKGATIIAHKEGVVKRFKNEEELHLIKQFILQ
jgi:hypothetical protein